MVARTIRRLPGFRVETHSPQLADSLPRMDVAVFVGFAASGPLHTPVAVETATQFEAIFGKDAPLVWDEQRGEPVYAHLAPAVRAFFQNGGKRCFIVRVASAAARSNYFPVPGLAVAQFGESGTVRLAPAFAQARSQGSWSDDVSVSATLLARSVQALRVAQATSGEVVMDAALDGFEPIRAGDLLRVQFDDRYVLMLAVDQAEPSAASPPGQPVIRLHSRRAVWFRQSTLSSPPLVITAAQATVFTRLHHPAPASEPFDPDCCASDPITVLNPAELSAPDRDGLLTVDLAMPFLDAPEPGALVRITAGNEELWLTVQDVSFLSLPDSPPREVTRLRGQGLWRLAAAPSDYGVLTPKAERLTFELWVKQGNEYAEKLSDLGFAAAQARFWGDLPTDHALYESSDQPFERGRFEVTFDNERIELWRRDRERRFPLAGVALDEALYLPLGVQAVAENYLSAVKQEGTQLERDGLAEFDASLFLDADLIASRTTTVMAQADFLRYLSPSPRPLRGIHAALSVEEATIIAVPDAAQRGWVKATEEAAIPAEPSLPPERPEWWHFLSCNPLPTIPRVSHPDRANFLDCDLREISAPFLHDSLADAGGTFALAWSSAESDVRFVLQEATRPDFSDVTTIYTGTEQRLTIYGRSRGDYYYRVRAEAGATVSDWSNGIVVSVTSATGYQLKEEKDYRSDALLAVHRALLRMCYGRGDLFAVFTLPEHYREDQAIEHIETLKFTPQANGDAQLVSATEGVALLSDFETNSLSYAALYHPWLIDRESAEQPTFRRTPSDGAICGVMAARSLARGAWIAPANEKLRGVVALTPAIARSQRLRLQEAQLNLIRQEPRGFTVLSADTLSSDVDVRPINVRRLLILLRRLALRLGARYVFEPNDDLFRRSVQRGFEAMLTGMFTRGAFKGRTPAESFQVVTGNALNTPTSVEQGRFIVELKVAPSLPMTFLTIRLVQTGDRTLVTEGR